MGGQIGFIGCGVITRSFIQGISLQNTPLLERIWVFDTVTGKGESLKKEFSVKNAKGYEELCRTAEIIVLAVKPSDFPSLLEEIKPFLGMQHLVVSLAAGISTAYLESILGRGVPVVRIMPNTAVSVGEGTMAMARGKYARQEDLDKVDIITANLGLGIKVEEKYMDAVTALSGSGPAYVYLFLEAIIDGAVELGLDRGTATRLAVQTVKGAASMAGSSSRHPAELRNAVTSPGGTTSAGLKVLEEGSMRAVIINAVAKAAQRARELELKEQKN